MSRVIKFRAWSKVGAGMSPASTFAEWLNTWAVAGGDATEELAEENVVLMQSTGLHDKNGKEIYEGDILQKNWTISSPELCAVSWDEKMAGFRVKGLDAVYNDILGVVVSGGMRNVPENTHNIEVIGNIYENPELLSQPTV